MRWLLTVSKHADLATVRSEVESVGAKLEDIRPVPSGSAQILYAEGPEDLRDRLEVTPTPIEASPHSEQSLYTPEPGFGA